MLTRRSSALLVLGLAAVAALILWQGAQEVLSLVARAGWPALAVVLLWLPHTAIGTSAWRVLFPPRSRPRWRDAFLATWMGTSVNTLLPAASIGGTLVKARIVTLWGADPALAAASAVVDKTVQAGVVLVWSVIGLLALASGAAIEDGFVASVALGLALLGAGIAGFVILQIKGSAEPVVRRLRAALASPVWQRFLGNSALEHAARLDKALYESYRRPGALALSFSLRLITRFMLLVEVLWAMHLMGYPVGLGEALALRGLVAALDAAFFTVPGGLGVQEGGYVAFGALLGLPGEAMIVLSLVTRARSVIPSVPGLWLWHRAEKQHRAHRNVATRSEMGIEERPHQATGGAPSSQPGTAQSAGSQPTAR